MISHTKQFAAFLVLLSMLGCTGIERHPPLIVPDTAGPRNQSADDAKEYASAVPSSQVALVAFETPDAPPSTAQQLPADSNAESLELADVVRSVEEAYPLIQSALLERQLADGKRLSAWGEFDLGLKAYTTSAPEGFYQTYRNGVSLTQPFYQGGYAFGGYKIGDGNFQPWYGERETNEGGEFSAGFAVPLLKDKLIDKRRAELAKAQLQRQAVEPAIQFQVLEYVQEASKIYWSWVAAGQALQAQQELLDLAEVRVEQIEERVRAGDLAEITRINNQQLIASRQAKVVESRRKLQQAAIKLSLFLRDADGTPQVPDEFLLPSTFPVVNAPSEMQLAALVDQALRVRPEFVELGLQVAQVDVELAQARNMHLPKLEAQFLAAQDVGGKASSKGDKSPFELEVGFSGEVPLQRRDARGKLLAAQAKQAQLQVKRRFLGNKVTAQVQDAVSALVASAQRVQLASNNVQLASETLDLARVQFTAGDIDLLQLNLYEQAVTDAQFQLIAASADYFYADADFHAVLAIDPLDSVESDTGKVQ